MATMRLKCLAGAYAGQVQDYSARAGLAALAAGTAERIGDTGPMRRPKSRAEETRPVQQPDAITGTDRKRKKVA